MEANVNVALAEFRKAMGMSQPQFAEWLNKKLNRRYDRNRISKMESGAEAVPAAVRLLTQRPAVLERTVVVAVANQKGGVGKTTTAVNLGYALAASGHETLIVDMDSQANATIHLGQNPLRLDEAQRTIYHVMLRRQPLAEVVVAVSDTAPLFLAPSSLSLAAAETELIAEPGSTQILAEKLKSLGGRFRFVVIDCAPQLGQLTMNALGAAHYVLVPTQTAALSMMGIPQLLSTIDKIQDRVNPGLSVFGILPTMFDSRTSQDKESLEELRALYGERYRIFPEVGQATIYPRSAAAGRITLEVSPDTRGMEIYVELAKALIDTVAREAADAA